MFKRIDNTTEIDTDFITCAEYQLFSDEMRAQGKYHQPDHWTAYTFFETTPKLSATAPVLGVRAEDAETFVNWLNRREKATYRLPTPTEAKEFPTNMKSVATWCYEDKKFTLGGLGKPEYQGIEQRLKKLSTLPLLNHWVSLFLSYPAYYHYSGFELDLAHALDLPHGIAHSVVVILNFTGPVFNNPSFPLDRSFNNSIAFISTRAFDLAAIIDQELYSLLLNARQFDTALSKIQQLRNDSPSIVQQRRLTLLIDLIHCQTATTSSGIRQALRKYAIRLLEYVWIGLNESEKEKTEEIVIRPWWQLWWQFWKQPSPKVEQADYLEVEQTDYLEKEQNILENYWQLKIIEAREAGELPAWEGIRLVRVTAEK
jgi:hypothetical protein